MPCIGAGGIDAGAPCLPAAMSVKNMDHLPGGFKTLERRCLSASENLTKSPLSLAAVLCASRRSADINWRRIGQHERADMLDMRCVAASASGTRQQSKPVGTFPQLDLQRRCSGREHRSKLHGTCGQMLVDQSKEPRSEISLWRILAGTADPKLLDPNTSGAG